MAGRLFAACLHLSVWAGLGGGTPAVYQEAAPPAANEAAPAPPVVPAPKKRAARLRLDVAKHVEKVLKERDTSGLPRYEDAVEVRAKSPQLMLERFFHELDLDCGAPSTGAPTEVEMRAARYHPAPYMDFTALAQAVGRLFKSTAPPRFFLYRVRGTNGVSYEVREGPIPQSMQLNAPGTTYELVEGFPDLKSATTAWRRLVRGFEGPSPKVDAPPPPPWVTTPCRPRAFR